MTGTIMRAQGEGERLWFYGGGVFTVKATADETGGSLFMFEDDMVQGKVTPLHLHLRKRNPYMSSKGSFSCISMEKIIL